MACSNSKTQDETRREESDDVRPLSVRLERVVEARPRPDRRGDDGDRDRSPIRSAGGEEADTSLPSNSAANDIGAGEAEATRTIRTRSGRVYTPAPTSDEEDEGADSDGSVDSIMSARSNCSSSTNASGRKKRGRPPTTGEYVGLAEAKKKFVEACEAEERVMEVESILDPTVPVRKPSKGSKPLPDEAALAREFRQRPTADVAAAVLEFQLEVEKVASVSKGLQGGFVRALRIAALNTRTAVTELATRSATAASRKLEEDNHVLRQQVAQLTAEVARLREDFDGRRNTMPPPPVPPPRAPEKKAAPPRPALPSREEGKSFDDNSGYLEERMFERIWSRLDAKIALIEKRSQGNGTSIVGTPGGSTETSTTSRGGGSTVTSGRNVRQGGSTSASGPSGAGGSTGGKTDPGTPAASGSERGKKRKKGGVTPVEKKAKTPETEGAKVSVPSGAPPALAETELCPQETWAKVIGRKEKRREKAAAAASSTSAATKAANTKAANKKGKKGGQGTAGKQKRILPARPPRTAAVAVTAPSGGKLTLGEVMTTVTARVKLADLGITRLRPRPAANGGLLLEVTGQDGASKADNLAAKMAEALEGTGARVARPVKRAEIRVRGLIPGTKPEDVAAAVAAVGGCRTEEVQTGEIRKASSGLGTLWMRCPAAAARKAAVERKVTVGWMEATVEALQARPLQCYKCLEVGHTRDKCPSETDRSGRCYNCGDPSHKANACTASPKCPVCSDKGRPAGHRLGGRACNHKAGKRKNKGGEKAAGAKAAAPAEQTAGSALAPAAEKETVADESPAVGPSGPEVVMQTAE